MEVLIEVISRVTILLTHIRGLMTPLITYNHEPPSIPVISELRGPSSASEVPRAGVPHIETPELRHRTPNLGTNMT